MKRSNELQVKEDFLVNGSSWGLLGWKFRHNSRKLQIFRFPTKKSELSEEKTIQTTWSVCLAKVSKIIYPCNSLLASIPIFSTFARQQTVFTGNSTELLLDFRSSKVCWMFRKMVSLTARQRSLDFR